MRSVREIEKGIRYENSFEKIADNLSCDDYDFLQFGVVNKISYSKKKNTTSWKSLVAFLIVMLIVGFVKTFADENSAPAPQPQVEGLEKVIIPEGTSNEIVNYEGFTVYFNRDTHIPNCTVYELTIGEAQATGKRIDNFQQDTYRMWCNYTRD